MQWAAPSGLHPLSSTVSQPRVELTVKYKCHRSERQCAGFICETGNRTGIGRVCRSRFAGLAMQIFGSPRHSLQELKHSLYKCKRHMFAKISKQSPDKKAAGAACHLCSGIVSGEARGGICAPGPLPQKTALARWLLSSGHIECCLLFYLSSFNDCALEPFDSMSSLTTT